MVVPKLAAISGTNAALKTWEDGKMHSTLGCTPARGGKLTDHTWTVEELLGIGDGHLVTKSSNYGENEYSTKIPLP
jgi:hypothetical protein